MRTCLSSLIINYLKQKYNKAINQLSNSSHWLRELISNHYSNFTENFKIKNWVWWFHLWCCKSFIPQKNLKQFIIKDWNLHWRLSTCLLKSLFIEANKTPLSLRKQKLVFLLIELCPPPLTVFKTVQNPLLRQSPTLNHSVSISGSSPVKQKWTQSHMYQSIIMKTLPWQTTKFYSWFSKMFKE